MSGTVAVAALAVLVGTAAPAAVGVVVQRGLAQLTERLDQLVRHPQSVQRELDQFWADLQDAESRRATAVDERLLGLEAALTQTQLKQDQVVQAVQWMLPLVQRFSDGEDER